MQKLPESMKIVRGQRAQPCRYLRNDAAVELLADRHGHDSQAILPVLQTLDRQGLPLSQAALGALADATKSSDSRVAGVASFYAMLRRAEDHKKQIRICDSPICMLNGAEPIRSAIEAGVSANSDWCVERTSCLGLCDRAPAALVAGEPCGPIRADGATELLQGWRGDTPSYAEPLPGETRVAMGRLGRVDPDSLDSALEAGAYQALDKALRSSPQVVLDEVEKSKLTGRGGAGFPTGKKWRMVAESNAEKKFIVCNADESEPGAFKDRVLLEGDPHLILEGMALAALAVGAREGIIYVRGEYERSAMLLERAIRQAEEAGWLGERVNGSDFSFHVHVHHGAGAYICGEETALLESLEGRRGEPRLRPPFPTTYGYLGQPTVVNNVETLAVVPAILLNGAAWFRGLGTAERPGVKMFTLTGHVCRPSVFEAPLGITIREAIDQFGLGLRSGSQFKMALTGGAAGMLAPESLLDVPITFRSHQQGVSLGSGVLMIFDTSVSAVTVLEWLLRFFAHESCGKCTPCREGVFAAHQVLQRILADKGRPGDLAWLRRTAKMLQATSLCGLGQSVAWPIESALEHFAKDFRRCGAQ